MEVLFNNKADMDLTYLSHHHTQSEKETAFIDYILLK